MDYFLIFFSVLFGNNSHLTRFILGPLLVCLIFVWQFFSVTVFYVLYSIACIGPFSVPISILPIRFLRTKLLYIVASVHIIEGCI